MDDDILQEFLAESREMLSQAQADLLGLENDPGNAEILGSIFRAFHTLKGGAGFLDAQSLVDWCHGLEDLLDKARHGAIPVTSQMVDVILRGTDIIESMLDVMAMGEYPEPGPAELKAIVHALANGEGCVAAPSAKDAADTVEAQPTAENSLWVSRRSTQEGTEGVYVEQRGAAPASAPSGDDISQDEFERYLDQLYGAGGAPGASKTPAPAAQVAAAPASAPAPSSGAAPASTAPGKEGRAAGGQTQTMSSESREESTIRVDSSRLDAVMNQVGELVLLRNRLNAALANLSQEDENLTRIAREADLAVNDLQGTVMRLRMQPCKRLFQALPRVVRDTSRSLGKNVQLELEGEDVEIDKTVVDALSPPLIHLVRNALDHGIESPAERQKFGKADKAVLRVAAVHLGDKVQIQVSDDGRGMNPQAILKSAVAKGVISAEEGARLSERDMLDLIFLPGFSTKEAVTDMSGRGVGMDVVRETVRGLRGRIDVQTRLNQGTTIVLELPLTLAVLPVLYFRLRRETYALPVAAIENLIEIDPPCLHTISGKPMYQVGRDRVVPYVDLGNVLQSSPISTAHESSEGILTEHGLLVVSEALGTEDSVVKPLDIGMEKTWYQGATISGGGDVVLILDGTSVSRAQRRV